MMQRPLRNTLGIGIDIVDLEHFSQSLRRATPAFYKRVYTQKELDDSKGRIGSLATRWACKEAIIKACSALGMRITFRDIEVLHASSGMAYAVLINRPYLDVEVSISDDGKYSVAVARVEAWFHNAYRPPKHLVFPDRSETGHKGTFGFLLVIAGSVGFTGAAYLCANAGVRIGAGLVRLLVPSGIYTVLAAKCTEVMVDAIDHEGFGFLKGDPLGRITEELDKANCVVIGPGLGTRKETRDYVVKFLESIKLPVVIDADGLNAIALEGKQDLLNERMVITPHPGEMSRLLKVDTTEVNANKVEISRQYAHDRGCVVVLKGANTCVASPDGSYHICSYKSALLASGGTGDVLAGIIGGLMAQGLEPYEAAVTGVEVHAAAAAYLQRYYGDAGLAASDLLGVIPYACAILRRSLSDK